MQQPAATSRGLMRGVRIAAKDYAKPGRAPKPSRHPRGVDRAQGFTLRIPYDGHGAILL
jgi:hypothetical protein